MAAGLYLNWASLFSLSPLTDRPSSNERLQPAFDIKTMVTVIIGYLSDDNFMTPPMRVNAECRSRIYIHVIRIVYIPQARFLMEQLNMLLHLFVC
jgi:hypothetical protein